MQTKKEVRCEKIQLSINNGEKLFFYNLAHNSDYQIGKIAYEMLMAYIPEFIERIWGDPKNINRVIEDLEKQRKREWNNIIKISIENFNEKIDNMKGGNEQ